MEIRSSRALPHLGDASLRRRQRAHGGGASCVEPLFKSPPVTRRPMLEVCPPVFCSVDTEMALDLVEVWSVEQTRSSRGGICRRW
jgi:hypothetical protein